MASEEHPPLGVSYIYGYDENNTSFPILAVAMNPNATGYALPALNSTTGLSSESIAANPTNKFTRVESVSEQRILWIYEPLPGASVSIINYDADSNSLITTTRTKKLLSAIDEGVVETGSGATAVMSVTQSEQISAIVGVEVVTSYPRGDAYSEATGIPSTDVLPFQQPMTFDMDMYVDAGVGFATLAFIKRVPHYKLTWFVIDDVEPALSLNGVIDFGQSYEIFGREFGGQVIYDAISAVSWGGFDFDFPGSVPDFTTYLADWVGGDPRSVLGSVRQDGGKFRWRVEKIFVQYELPRRATLTPP